MTALDLTLREEVARPERRRAGRAAWLTVPVILGLIVFVGWLVIALTITLWSPYDPLATTGLPLLPPSAEHLLGTDALGRDVLARTLYGVRASLPLCFAVIAGGVLIGSLFGAVAGFFGGWVDAVLMRITDVVLAFPAILLAMVMTAALGPGLFHAGIAMVLVWWPIYARLLRAQILSVKEQAHVEAAVAAGAGRWRQLRIHILPLAITPTLVNATMDLGQVVLLAAGLSFIGLGATPPTPEWGLMINDGTIHFYQWWVALGPGLAILSLVLAFNFIGDGVRDLLDVRTPGRSA
jgi:peptide/nickel transport system permease protein